MMLRMSLVAAAALVVAIAVPGDASFARTAGPPPGLTRHGQNVWNLDALLHETFGRRTVYLNSQKSYPRSPRNFSTAFHGACCSSYYIYTFANATDSAFKMTGPTKPPKPSIGASGYEVPLTIRGAYIYCGRNTWLFEHGGNGPANWQISCHG